MGTLIKSLHVHLQSDPPDIKSQSIWVPLTVLSLSVWALLPPTSRPRPPRVPSTSTSSLETTGSSFSHIQKISHQVRDEQPSLQPSVAAGSEPRTDKRQERRVACTGTDKS